MKKLLLICCLGVLLIGAGCLSGAKPIIWEPSATYIHALKNCSKTDFYEHKDKMVYSYKINGLNTDKKCAVSLAAYEDYEEKEVYEDVIKFVKAFGGENVKESDIPAPEELFESAKRENMPLECLFSEKQRKALYNAYQADNNRFKFWSRAGYQKRMASYYPKTCKYPSETEFRSGK